MATSSKLGDRYGLSKEGLAALFWSGLALFFDGLFWRVVLALGRAFKFLGALIDEFYVVARAPPPFQDLPPPLEPIPYPIIDAVKPDDGNQGDRPAVGPSWASPKHELGRRPIHRPPTEDNLHWAKGLRGSAVDLKPGDIGHQKVHRPYSPSAPLDPNVQAYLAPRDGVDKASKVWLGTPWLVQSSDPKVVKWVKSFSSSVGTSRKAFRLGKFIQDVNALRKAPSVTSSDGFLEVLATTGEGIYYFKWSVWAEFIGYLGSVVLKYRVCKLGQEAVILKAFTCSVQNV